MMKRIAVNLTSSAKMFFRNRGAVFWTIFFPIVLILLFGAIFSSSGSSSFTLYVQDKDGTDASQQFIESLNSTNILTIVMVDPDVNEDDYIKEHSVTSFLVIPEGFSSAYASPTERQNASIELRLDQTSSSSSAVATAVNAVVDGTNLYLANGTAVIGMTTSNIVQEQFSYIDFFLPGVIGLMVMQDTINFVIGTQTRYRANGIFRKLATTPITQGEWLLSQALWQLVIVAISVATILIVGVLAFNMHISLSPVAVAMIIVSAIMFSAIGLIIARFVKDEEIAGAAAGAITFPMMFLSGSFFPLESMPGYLQAIAQVLPLTYVNNGLRDTMIYGNEAAAIANLVIVAVLAIVLMVVGALVSTWKEK